MIETQKLSGAALALLVTGEKSTPGATRLFFFSARKATGRPTHMPIVTALAWCKLLVPEGLCVCCICAKLLRPPQNSQGQPFQRMSSGVVSGMPPLIDFHVRTVRSRSCYPAHAYHVVIYRLEGKQLARDQRLLAVDHGLRVKMRAGAPPLHQPAPDQPYTPESVVVELRRCAVRVG